MAELGVIASGVGAVSLASEIGNSVLKLKAIFNSAKEAPEEIKDLIEEIETLSLVLSDVGKTDEKGDLPDIAPKSAARRLELGRTGAVALKSLLRELEVDIGNRRMMGSFKVILKKGRWRE